MKRFVKNPDLKFVSIPGVGPLKEGTILMGNEFSKYAPRFLVEVPDLPPGGPLENREPQRGPVPLNEPAPMMPREPVQAPDLLEEEEPVTAAASPQVKRPRGRPRKYPLPG